MSFVFFLYRVFQCCFVSFLMKRKTNDNCKTKLYDRERERGTRLNKKKEDEYDKMRICQKIQDI